MTATWNERVQKTITLCLFLLLVWAIASPVRLSAFAGLGGYISEKLLGDGTNEALYLGDGTNERIILGSGPVVSTGSATSTSSGGVASMILRGNLSNLNGMPRADTRFEWGYASGALSNSTANVTATVIGEQTATINPTVGSTVYYRFVVGTDGTSYGATRSLVVGGGHGVSYWFMHTLLPIIIGAMILILVFALTGNPIVALVAAVIGLVGFYLALAMVSVF